MCTLQPKSDKPTRAGSTSAGLHTFFLLLIKQTETFMNILESLVITKDQKASAALKSLRALYKPNNSTV